MRKEEQFKTIVFTTMHNSFRNWKTKLHAHYESYSTDEERLANILNDVKPDDWEWLVRHFGNATFKNKSLTNKTNRRKQTTKHTCGPQSFAEVEESAKDPTTGESAPPDQVWEIQHTRKTADGQLEWANPQSQEIHARIQELMQQQQEHEGACRLTSDEILSTVLGERSGFVRGKGYGAQPSRKRAHSQTSDASLVETMRQHMEEEFARRFEAEQARMEKERAAERAKMEEERATERARMEKQRAAEHAQLEQRMTQMMEERIQSQLAALMASI